MDIVKTRVTLKMSFSKNCGTLKNTEIYKKFDNKRKKWAVHITLLARFYKINKTQVPKYMIY